MPTDIETYLLNHCTHVEMLSKRECRSEWERFYAAFALAARGLWGNSLASRLSDVMGCLSGHQAITAYKRNEGGRFTLLGTGKALAGWRFSCPTVPAVEDYAGLLLFNSQWCFLTSPGSPRNGGRYVQAEKCTGHSSWLEKSNNIEIDRDD